MFLGIGKPYFLGIDFGTSLIKAVELTLEEGKPRLLNYGQVDLGRLEKGIVTGENTHDDEVILYLRALLEKLQPKSEGVYAAMPDFTGLVSLIELPEMDEDDLKEAIQFEAHKYIPSSLEDVALSWEVVGKHPASDGSSAAKIAMKAKMVIGLDRVKPNAVRKSRVTAAEASTCAACLGFSASRAMLHASHTRKAPPTTLSKTASEGADKAIPVKPIAPRKP